MTINIYFSHNKHTTKDIHLIKYKIIYFLICILLNVYFIIGLWTFIFIITFIIIPSLILIYLLLLNNKLQKTNPTLYLVIIILLSTMVIFGLGYLLINGKPGFGMGSGSGNNSQGGPGGNGKLPPNNKSMYHGKDSKRELEDGEEYYNGIIWKTDFFKKTGIQRSCELAKQERRVLAAHNYREGYDEFIAKENNGTGLIEEDYKKIKRTTDLMKNKLHTWITDDEKVAEKLATKK